MDKNFSDNITEIVKIKFTKIKDIRNKIKDKFKKLQQLKQDIKNNYVLYLKKEQYDYTGLDSFHFQNKVLELEFENMMKLYQFIDNRIYGDYYKLFSQIEKFLHQNLKPKQYDKIKELKNIDKYPVYKDLDKFKTYDFDTINNVHQDIIVIIACVKDVLKENNKLIAEDLKLQMSGLNIDNYVINNQYKNMVLMTTNQKFENYLQVFHKYHYDLLCKFYEKIHLCIQHIDHSPNDERFFSDNSDSSNAGDSEKEHDVDDSILFNQFSTTPLNKHYDSNKNKDNQFFHTEKATFEKTLYNETQILDLSNTVVNDKNEVSMNIPEEDQEQQDNITVDCESLPEQNQNDEFTTVASKKKRKKRNKKKNGENNNDTNNE
jgi:hypothetical protein